MVESVLRIAMSLGETIIVTNGAHSWVEDSVHQFLPGLLPILAELTIVSARSLYEDIYPGDPFAWKRATFEHLLTRERNFLTGLNLVSLGDQQPELDAAHHVARLLGSSTVVKTIRFKEAPSVAELIGQLCRAERVLCRIVQDRESQTCSFARRELSTHLPHHISRASGWSCESKDKSSWRSCSSASGGLEAIWVS